MTAISREKIALVVFALLVLVGIGSLVAYLSIGHSWNVTASQIDDATGELEGYTAILYAGTAVAEEDDKDAGVSARTSRDSQAATSGSTGQRFSGSTSDSARTAPSVEAGASVSADAPYAGPAASDDVVGSSEAAGGQDPSSSGESSDSASSASDASRAAGGGTPLFNSARSSTEQKEPVTVEDAAASYREKQATVFTLDTTNLAKYSEGMILKKGERRFGVFSVAFNEPLPSVQRKVDYLAEHQVDFIVAITPDRSFVEQATGIDLVISLQNEGISFMGETVGGTFYVDSPLVGQVGAILISPHNVVSAKDIEEL